MLPCRAVSGSTRMYAVRPSLYRTANITWVSRVRCWNPPGKRAIRTMVRLTREGRNQATAVPPSRPAIKVSASRAQDQHRASFLAPVPMTGTEMSRYPIVHEWLLPRDRADTLSTALIFTEWRHQAAQHAGGEERLSVRV